MIPRAPFDRGSRVLVKMWGELFAGTVLSGHEWIDEATGEHRRRRMVMLDKPAFKDDPGRWNCAFEDLRSESADNGEVPRG